MGQLPWGPPRVFACQWGCPCTRSQSTRGQGCPHPFSPNALLTPARDTQPHHRTQSCWEMLSPGRGTWPPPAPGDSQGHHFLPAGSRLAAQSHPSELGLRTKPLAAHVGWGAGGSDLMGPLPLLMGPPIPEKAQAGGCRPPPQPIFPLHPICPPQGPSPTALKPLGAMGASPCPGSSHTQQGKLRQEKPLSPPVLYHHPQSWALLPALTDTPPPLRAAGTHTHWGVTDNRTRLWCRVPLGWAPPWPRSSPSLLLT